MSEGCGVCGEDVSGGGSHYHCGRCGDVKPTSMIGHSTTFCKATGQRTEQHMCCPGSCELNEPVASAPPHPAVAQVLRWFTSKHLPADLAVVVSDCYALAEKMAELYPDGGPELTVGLRHLLEAKDCFVRAAIVQREANQTKIGPATAVGPTASAAES